MKTPGQAPGPRRGALSGAAGTAPGAAFRTIPLLLILAGAGAGAVPPAGDTAPPPALLFALIGPDYKRPQELPDTFFNPFKVEETGDLGMERRGATVTDQGVAAAVGRRGVSGIVFAADAGGNQVIIGDQVFRIGDELVFPDGDALAPLIAGASVTLREVGRNILVFDFAAEGEASRRAAFPLRNFWRP